MGRELKEKSQLNGQATARGVAPTKILWGGTASKGFEGFLMGWRCEPPKKHYGHVENFVNVIM